MNHAEDVSSVTPTARKETIRLSIENGIAWVVLDLPGEKVNKLSSLVMNDLVKTLDQLESREDLEGAVIASGKDGMFIAGADIREIEKVCSREGAMRAARLGQAIFERIQNFPFPVVAAIGGACLGGGTEVALACHGRVGSDHPRFQIGFPEVNLGILPAWTGTTKLPRLVGLREGLELILTGRSIDARKAERIGLLDAAVPHARLREEAVKLVKKLKASGNYRELRRRRPLGPAGWLLEANPVGRLLAFHQARKKILSRTRGHYPAPLKVIQVMKRSYGLPIDRALALEAEAAGELMVSPVSKNLIHLFFLGDRARKDPGVEGEVTPVEIHRAGLLGAGTMGGGIAWLLSSRDIPVRVKDVDPRALGAGLRAARRIHEERKRRGRLTAWELEKQMSLIRPTLDWSGFRGPDIVLEAIVEEREIKKKIFRELEPVLRGNCLLASNTSTIPISELQSVLRNPERMAGFHFFNPVERMPLVEVIRGKSTSDRTTASLVAFARRLGKTPVVVADGPGFLVNRLLGPYLNEACHLLLESGDLEGIDRALVDFGMPMGPLRLLDEVGIDVAAKAGRVLAEAYGGRASPSEVIEKLAAAGRLGKKSGQGLYRHGGRKERPDPEALALLGIRRRRAVAPEEAIERSVYPMVSEAARVLEEKVVRGPGDLDLAMVMGIGFPPFRGGVLRYAEALGLQAVVEALRRWADKLGPRFEPSPALIERARSGHGFYS